MNQQRHTLIVRAAGQLAWLAAALNQGILKHKKGTSLAPEVQVAELIETLAKNVNAAVKLEGEPAVTARAAASDPEDSGVSAARSTVAGAPTEGDLSQDAGALLLAVRQLGTEVRKSDEDTLSLGVLTKSAEIERVARSLRARMKKTAAG